MKIKIWNFEIEPDRNWYILSEYWIGEDTGERYLKNQTYPSTIERALIKIAHKEKQLFEWEFWLEEAISKFEEINNKLIKWIKQELKAE